MTLLDPFFSHLPKGAVGSPFASMMILQVVISFSFDFILNSLFPFLTLAADSDFHAGCLGFILYVQLRRLDFFRPPPALLNGDLRCMEPFRFPMPGLAPSPSPP